jgi:hypothetical protein
MLKKLLSLAVTGLATALAPALAALLVMLLISGCGDDKSTSPPPNPALTMSVECNNGLVDLTVRNTGGAMNQSSPFCANFADGHCDTLMLGLGNNDSMSCRLSNIHGDVSVTNDEWDLEAAGGGCLSAYFQSILASVNLDSLIPSPLGQQTVILCTYTVDLQHLTVNQATAELVPTDDGLTLRFVFSNITGNFSAPSPGALCADLTGNIAISSLVVETDIDLGGGDDPQITLGETEATINGLVVNVDGLFGWVVEIIVSSMQGDFTPAIENNIATQINSHVPDLNALVIVNTGCAE